MEPCHLTWKAREYGIATRFIELAGEINMRMPYLVVERVVEAVDRHAGKAFTGARVLVLGLAYKKNIDDMRESPSLKLIELMEARGSALRLSRPVHPRHPGPREHAALAGRRSVPLDPMALARYDAVLIATDHDGVDYRQVAAHARVVVDTRNACQKAGVADDRKLSELERRIEGRDSVMRHVEGSARNVRVAVVGCGYWGKNHVRNYAEIGALEALVDKNEAAVEGLIAKYGGRALSFDKALADPRIDALSFAMPPSQNHALGLRALEAGKHLLIEKPIALEPKHAEEALRRRRAVRPTPHGWACPAIPPGFPEAEGTGAGGAAWAIALHQLEPAEPGAHPTRGGCVLELRAARHIDDPVAGRQGARDSRSGRRLSPPPEHCRHHDDAHVVLQPASRRIFSSPGFTPSRSRSLPSSAPRRWRCSMTARSWERKLLLYPHKMEWRDNIPVPAKADPIPVEVERKEPLREECLHFLDCVITGACPRTDGREGLRVLRVLDRASQALRTARTSFCCGSRRDCAADR